MQDFILRYVPFFFTTRSPDESTDADEYTSSDRPDDLCHLRTLDRIAKLLSAEIAEGDIENIAAPHPDRCCNTMRCPSGQTGFQNCKRDRSDHHGQRGTNEKALEEKIHSAKIIPGERQKVNGNDGGHGADGGEADMTPKGGVHKACQVLVILGLR